MRTGHDGQGHGYDIHAAVHHIGCTATMGSVLVMTFMLLYLTLYRALAMTFMVLYLTLGVRPRRAWPGHDIHAAVPHVVQGLGYDIHATVPHVVHGLGYDIHAAVPHVGCKATTGRAWP